MIKMISNIDLLSNCFSIQELKDNIEWLNLVTILKTQYIDDWDFVVQYILNSKYQTTPEEKYIDVSYVLLTQPHLRQS